MAAFADIVDPPRGMVPLSQKLAPIFLSDPPYDEFYAYTRAEVDVSGFRAHLSSLPPSAWDDELQEGNVKLVRPAHDAWGIQKIVFTFCDDFLQRVFDLPWSQQPLWQQFLRPIYASIGVDESRIVRSLLASMPPGITIPVHHDTGLWVKKTHRIHVALETGDEVDFLAGPTEDQMKKVCAFSLFPVFVWLIANCVI